MAVEFFRTLKVHGSILSNFREGDDVFTITVPPNQILLEIRLEIIEKRGGAAATITQSLPQNFTGTGTIIVHWRHAWFSAITYEIIAISGCLANTLGAIKRKWEQLGAESGFLGCPLIDETKTDDKDGRYNDFIGGSIYWHPKTGAFEIHGEIRTKWKSIGSETQKGLGYPMTDETATPDGIGRYNHFERGSIYWYPNRGAFYIKGKIREKWSLYGWEKGFLGYPIADPVSSAGGVIITQKFEGGEIVHNMSTGFTIVKRKASPIAPRYEIEIYAIRARDNDGSRETNITTQNIQKWVEGANMIFEVAGLKFIYNGSMEVIDDTEINNVTGEDYLPWKSVKQKLNQIASRERKIIVLFRNGSGGFSWSSYDFVVMPEYGTSNSCVGLEDIGLLAHELGHYFGLPHTFGRELNTFDEALNLFQSNGGNSAIFDGDISVIHDTAPDPYIKELQCDFNKNAVVFGGTPLKLERENIMSYYQCEFERKTFSLEQTNHIRQALIERRNRGLQVTEIIQ